MADPFRYFRIEATELAAQLDHELLALEARPDGARVARLLRLTHTLKGAARIVKHAAIAELAHALEDVLAPLRGSGTGPLEAASALVAQIASQVAALAPTAALASTAAPMVDTAALPRVEPGLLDRLLGGLGEVHAQLAALRGARPDLPELDALERGLATARTQAEQLRLLPASTVIGSLERTAHDAAQAMAKQVQLTAIGGDVRVDARVLAGLHGALVQLVRNAVAHGIESPADRRAAGKPAAGHIAIRIWMRGDRVVMQCEDDGRGIDLAAVRAVALERGLIDRAATPSDDALIALLLCGGLSTARGVTALAGRGIGLDLVGDAVRGLDGEVRVHTAAGAGTTIALEAPCAVTAMATLVVVAGRHTVAIPQAAVHRVVSLARGELAAGVLAIRGDGRCKLVTLARILGGPPGAPRAAVVIGHGDARAALAIDRVVGLDEVVVRALAAAVPVAPVVRGVALDAAGVPRPVLEPAAVIAAATQLDPEAAPAAASAWSIA